MRDDLALEAVGLSKRYLLGQLESGYGLARRVTSRRDRRQELWAVNDVSFQVKEGETLGIIGRNGAGKSTMLKVLARITEPTKGYVDVRGRVGALLELGTGFSGDLTGRENVFMNGSVLGMTRQEVARKFDDIVEFAGVEKFIDTPVKRYSSGMYVRLAFAVAAFLEPEILIVDEVLSVGDAEFQKRCLGRMNEVSRDGRTVLFVSHNMQAVRRLCTRSLLLEQGKLVDEGATEAIVRRYLSSIEAPEAGRREWTGNERPGDELCRVNSITLTSSQGEPVSTFLSSQPIYVALDFDLSEVHTAFTAGFDLVSYDMTTVFRSMQSDLPEASRPALQPGRNVITCTIPPGLLNGGRYYINTRISLHYIRWIMHEDQVLQFDVVADHGDSYFLNQKAGDRPGVIHPILPWTAGEVPAELEEPAVGSPSA